MNRLSILAGATALAALSVPAFAQTEIAAGADATGVSAINTRITDVEDVVKDDFKRSEDSYRFGNPDRREGVSGSISLTYTGRTGNKEDQDFLLAGRMTHNMGVFSQNVGIALEFTENDSGEKDAQKVFTVYDAMYNFNDQFYAFALGRLVHDQLAEDENLRRDGFLGVGPGYRVFNTDQTAWRIQAGVGVRYTQTGTQRDEDTSTTETGWIVSSRFYHRFNDQIILTNDTDYLDSKDAGKTITNELAANFRMSEAFATRVSYRTEYQSEREIRTDNKLGVALVYGF